MTASAERIPSEYERMHQHTTEVPCLGCRYALKGSQAHAKELDCPKCRHFHEPGPCPEVKR